MKLSVIIPCYNGAKTIGEQLEALASQVWAEPWEIIVADNRSTDNSMAIVKQYQACLPNLRIVDASARQGQPYALNYGAEAAVGESLAFCDADDVVGPGWLPTIGEALNRYDFVACRFDTEKLNAPWLHKSRANPQQNGLKKYTHPPYLYHAGGGSLGVKRVLHEAIGGFDETLPILHDTDYCWRLQLAGTELNFVPDAVMYIRYRDTLDGIYRQAGNYAEYNVLLYKRYRLQGMPPISLKAGLLAWVKLAQRPQRLLRLEGRAKWVWQFGWCMGRLRGSIKHRVLAL